MRTILNRSALAALALLAAPVLPAAAQSRLPTIPPDQYNAEEKQAAAEFLEARKKPVFGPFSPLMHSPQVMTLARSMGDYLRFKSSIGNVLSEFVILVTARHWTQDYEWSVHAPIALKQGIKPETVDAIADGRRPDNMSEDETICYQFITELMNNKRVSDVTYARAQKRFGDKGVVDLTAIVGYYTFLAMSLNTAQTPPEPGAPHLKHFPD